MNNKTKAFLLNLLCFAVVFVIVRTVLLLFFSIPYLVTLLISAILASIATPKFLEKKGVLWVKFPWKKAPVKC